MLYSYIGIYVSIPTQLRYIVLLLRCISCRTVQPFLQLIFLMISQMVAHKRVSFGL